MRTKKKSIKRLENNLKEGRERFNRGEVTREQWQRMQKDARHRIAELKAGEK